MNAKAFPSLNMSSSSLSLFLALLLCVTRLESVDGVIQTSNRSETDRLSLFDVKSQLQDPSGTLASWNSSVDHCMWLGVVCGRRHRRVTVLDLSSLGLVGMLSPSIGNLSFLHELYIYNNSFQGELPAEISHLSRLRMVRASKNFLTGRIPANLGNCKNLVRLYLDYNDLVGIIPTQLGSLSMLEELELYGNRLTGVISVVCNLTSLQTLSLSSNAFRGTIPDSLGRLKRLTFLGLADNNLSGLIPPSLYNLSSLTVLQVCENRLEGSLHQDIGLMLPRLEVAFFYTNLLSGLLPSSLSNLSEIRKLYLQENHLSGKIVISGENLPELSGLGLELNYLGLGSNDLNFMESLVNCSKLQVLDVSINNLFGKLPSSVSNLSTTLQYFTVADNHIWGSVPSGLTKLANLQIIDISRNQFTGAIPDDVGSLSLLYFASFQSNRFSGNIPPSFGNLTLLSVLSLSINQLEGQIPSTLGNCKNLLRLFLAENRLTGLIPAQLFTADASLFYLMLAVNRLTGSLPLEVGQSKSIVSLSVSDNELSDEIPESLGSCITLRELDLSGNVFRGSIPESFSALRSLELLDLSVNNLTGPIPSYLSSFPLTLMNLSFNDFEGEIPTNGVFANISAVSLEGNDKLCGGLVELHFPRCIPRELKPSHRSKKKVIMIIRITCGATGIAVVLLILFSMPNKKSRNLSYAQSSFPPEQFLNLSYEMLLKATAGFSPANLIGMGSFGSVFKGMIAISDATEVPIAVKVLNLQRRGSSKSFIAECKALTRIRHRNLVKVLSACSSIDYKGNDFKALIYEFISNGSLEQWLYPEGTEDQNVRFQRFGLLCRINVAIDMAYVLDYLHCDSETAVIHCDIKPSNILLDDDMVAHLGDFGLSRLVADAKNRNRSSSMGVRGTVGYAAPEYGLGSPVSTKGDAYSFGILLLELMMRRRPTDPTFGNGHSLHELAKVALLDLDQTESIVDAALFNDEVGATNPSYPDYPRDRKIKCIMSVLKVGVTSSMESPGDRLTMKDAISELTTAKEILLGARAASNPHDEMIIE